MDDLDARRFAHRVGLPAIGTLGLLLAARLRGDIPSVKAEIERLRGFGFWAGDALVEAVLKTAGE
jgi:predicted nucleic acid-binding protein